MTARIDRDKLRVALHGLDEDTVFDMLGEALDLLPPGKLAIVVGRHVDLVDLRPDAGLVWADLPLCGTMYSIYATMDLVSYDLPELVPVR
jgi:hypothetical protein